MFAIVPVIVSVLGSAFLFGGFAAVSRRALSASLPASGGGAAGFSVASAFAGGDSATPQRIMVPILLFATLWVIAGCACVLLTVVASLVRLMGRGHPESG
jgi:hypothetical protein